jgi:hypothetical protein
MFLIQVKANSADLLMQNTDLAPKVIKDSLLVIVHAYKSQHSGG